MPSLVGRLVQNDRLIHNDRPVQIHRPVQIDFFNLFLLFFSSPIEAFAISVPNHHLRSLHDQVGLNVGQKKGPVFSNFFGTNVRDDVLRIGHGNHNLGTVLVAKSLTSAAHEGCVFDANESFENPEMKGVASLQNSDKNTDDVCIEAFEEKSEPTFLSLGQAFYQRPRDLGGHDFADGINLILGRKVHFHFDKGILVALDKVFEAFGHF